MTLKWTKKLLLAAFACTLCLWCTPAFASAEYDVGTVDEELSAGVFEDSANLYSFYAADASGTVNEYDTAAAALAASSKQSASNGLTTMSNGRYAPGNYDYNNPLIVAIDAGHGGKDGGAGGYAQEASCNLKIAKACAYALQEYYGCKVVMTRTSDNYISLTDRVDYAISRGADIVVSIHCNASESSSGNGCEAIVPRAGTYNKIGTDLAQKILKNISALGIKYRYIYSKDCTSGDKYSDGTLMDYFTLISGPREKGVTGIIVEHAFVTNPTDGEFLSDDENLTALGEADAKGIAEQFQLEKITEENLALVYDYDYYIANNADVAEAYDGDHDKTLHHFLEYGMSEGRQACATFDPNYYKEKYEDLQDSYGSDMQQYYYHYLEYGADEGRQGSYDSDPGATAEVLRAEAHYLGVYNYKYYLENNPDVAEAFDGDRLDTLNHFLEYGMDEGRQGCENFDVFSYRNEYPDLRAAFDYDLKSYYLHYLEYGKSEKRNTTGCSYMAPSASEEKAEAKYALVYDYDYYIENNSDVDEYFHSDRTKVLNHFINYGMSEGRMGLESFDVYSYRNEYPDLRAAFGKNLKSYYLHYIEYGKSEGRHTTGFSYVAPSDAEVKAEDAYSAVYDYTYYVSHNSDVSEYYMGDRTDVLNHFINYGMSEGRQGCESFDVYSYRNEYGDLRAAYGDNLKSYYLHYIKYGKYEGRNTSGCTYMSPTPAEQEAEAAFYAVYDYDYYLAHNSDVAEYFHNDRTDVLNHFINYGMSEGRQGCESFNWYSYYLQYPDLRAAFGSNKAKYYYHYIEYGQTEGRDGTGCTEMVPDESGKIMGVSSVTVSQMVSRYKSVGKTYPSSVYTQYGAATIEDFCQILYEEANAEGVRAEVVYAQSMVETGWLQFGGDVSADQCNFAGLGATGGVPGNSFNTYGTDSVRMGLRAQVQHLKAYASTDALNNTCVDTRFGYVKRGCAPNVSDLAGTWAASTTYGTSLMTQIKAVLAE